jgi:hypothetical protein
MVDPGNPNLLLFFFLKKKQCYFGKKKKKTMGFPTNPAQARSWVTRLTCRSYTGSCNYGKKTFMVLDNMVLKICETAVQKPCI